MTVHMNNATMPALIQCTVVVLVFNMVLSNISDSVDSNQRAPTNLNFAAEMVSMEHGG